MFSKIFGKCLPSRKGKTIEDPPVIDTQEKSEGDAKKVESPKIFEKESLETKPTNEESDPAVPEEPEIEEEKEPVEETAKEGSTNNAEFEGEAVETVDPEAEDSLWEVSCCGVDMPLSK
mmetsp:Transcript_17090/g.35259  ORF Transcript_17090/g.35259 Transcript_17090/m.35259 type:complete len:119 (+) Transcript_17090:165-521(+)